MLLSQACDTDLGCVKHRHKDVCVCNILAIIAQKTRNEVDRHGLERGKCSPVIIRPVLCILVQRLKLSKYDTHLIFNSSWLRLNSPPNESQVPRRSHRTHPHNTVTYRQRLRQYCRVIIEVLRIRFQGRWLRLAMDERRELSIVARKHFRIGPQGAHAICTGKSRAMRTRFPISLL